MTPCAAPQTPAPTPRDVERIARDVLSQFGVDAPLHAELVNAVWRITVTARAHGVLHVRTLRAAAADGRLRAQFSSRSYFGHPIARATRADTRAFVAFALGRSARALGCRSALASPPADYPARIIAIRRQLRLTQSALARRVGAASKAVVYQWESRKRIPSPVLWTRLHNLERRAWQRP